MEKELCRSPSKEVLIKFYKQLYNKDIIGVWSSLFRFYFVIDINKLELIEEHVIRYEDNQYILYELEV
ncbi:MAG: hypothetical protein J6T10_21600 [Methanobrevibacter sp.]|nr:hypothetical protein [Methanobrevibacter sp.]